MLPESPEPVLTSTEHASEDALIQEARTLANDTHWRLGQLAAEWTEKYSRGRTDKEFAALIGEKTSWVAQRRLIWETFSHMRHQMPNLHFSHFREALGWEDRIQRLQWANEMGATVRQMIAKWNLENGDNVVEGADDEPVSMIPPVTANDIPDDDRVAKPKDDPDEDGDDDPAMLERPAKPKKPKKEREPEQATSDSSAPSDHDSITLAVKSVLASPELIWAVLTEQPLDQLLEAVRTISGDNKQKAVYCMTLAYELDPSLKPKEAKPTTLNKEREIERGFDQFWTIYPKKRAKGYARKAFRSAVKKHFNGECGPLLNAAQNYADHCSRLPPGEDRFIPHPSTWINGERWDDDATADQGTTGRTEQQMHTMAEWLRGSDDSTGEQDTLPAVF